MLAPFQSSTVARFTMQQNSEQFIYCPDLVAIDLLPRPFATRAIPRDRLRGNEKGRRRGFRDATTASHGACISEPTQRLAGCQPKGRRAISTPILCVRFRLGARESPGIHSLPRGFPGRVYFSYYRPMLSPQSGKLARHQEPTEFA